MTIGWNFPKNNHGQIAGIGEAGVETFKGSPFDSLAREICQNSLDAKLINNEPVVIEFKEFKIKREQLTKVDDLREAFTRSIEFCEEYNNDIKTMKFLNEGIKIIDSNEISVLRISDFNTTGLIGSDKEFGTPWHNLVKSSGVSNKSGTSGGSFGIGKSAPYACTDLRTIYYSTLDENELVAHQGVSRLVTFRDEDGDTTAGMGYYGNKEDNSPIMKPLFLDNEFSRSTSGTDIFILGFQENNSWKMDMIKAVLDGFLIAIYEGNIKVMIGDQEISNVTLPLLMDQYKDNLKKAYNYYQVLTSEETQDFIYEMEGLGKVNFKVLLNPNLHRQVLITRINGMKLFDRGYISSTIHFAGILRLIDEPANAFFRLLEPPEHNAWEPDRSENKALARSRIKEINGYMKDKVLEIGKIPASDEMDAEGIGEYLPDDISLLPNSQSQDKDESISNKISDMEIIVRERKIEPKGLSKEVDEGKEEEVDILVDPDDEGDLEGSKPSGKPNESDGGKSLGGRYSENPNGENVARKIIQVKTVRLRLFVIDNSKKQYKLIFTPNISCDSGFIKISMSGESGNLKAIVKDAILEGNISKKLKTKEDKIYFENMEANMNTQITFILDYSEVCSLEVGIYGYKE